MSGLKQSVSVQTELDTTFNIIAGKALSIQTWTEPKGSRRSLSNFFLENLHISVTWMLARQTGRHFRPGDNRNTRVCWKPSRAQGHGASGRIMPIKKISLTPPGIETKTFQISQIKHQLDATLCRFYFCRVTLNVSDVKRPSSGILKNWHGGPWYRCYSCR